MIELTNRQIEKDILGIVIYNNSILLDITDKLLPDYFSVNTYQVIYGIMLDMYMDKQPIDLMTLGEEIKGKNICPTHIFELVDGIFTDKFATKYASILKDLYIKRQILAYGQDLIEQIKTGVDSDELCSGMIDKALNLNYSKTDNVKHIKTVLHTTVKQIESAWDNKGINGIESGLHDIDRVVCGFKPKFYVLAGRPGTGKTAMATNIAISGGLKGGKALIFSLEMPDEEVGIRMISGEAKIDNQLLENGNVKDTEWPKMAAACSLLSQADIYIDDAADQTDMDIWTKAKRHKIKYGLDIVIIDYLQLVKSSKKLIRREEIEEISRNFKKMSKDLGVPVLCLAQLSRACEQEKRKPRLSDLRESGGIEQDADVVIFTHHPHSIDTSEPEDVIEAIFAKHRGGPKGIVKLNWTPEYTKFSDIMSTYS
jgi:replicative DNA helicase